MSRHLLSSYKGENYKLFSLLKNCFCKDSKSCDLIFIFKYLFCLQFDNAILLNFQRIL